MDGAKPEMARKMTLGGNGDNWEVWHDGEENPYVRWSGSHAEDKVILGEIVIQFRFHSDQQYIFQKISVLSQMFTSIFFKIECYFFGSFSQKLICS